MYYINMKKISLFLIVTFKIISTELNLYNPQKKTFKDLMNTIKNNSQKIIEKKEEERKIQEEQMKEESLIRQAEQESLELFDESILQQEEQEIPIQYRMYKTIIFIVCAVICFIVFEDSPILDGICYISIVIFVIFNIIKFFFHSTWNNLVNKFEKIMSIIEIIKKVFTIFYTLLQLLQKPKTKEPIQEKTFLGNIKDNIIYFLGKINPFHRTHNINI